MKRTTSDKLFSDIIRTRDNWTCQRCGNSPSAKQGLHNSHFIGRGKYNTRFDERNCVALCYGCHRYFTSNPIEHHDFFQNHLGKDEFVKIHTLANTRCGDNGTPRKPYYESKEFRKILRERLKELNNG